MYIYIYLEVVCPLFLALTPPKQGLFQSKQGSFGFQVNYTFQHLLKPYTPEDAHSCNLIFMGLGRLYSMGPVFSGEAWKKLPGCNICPIPHTIPILQGILIIWEWYGSSMGGWGFHYWGSLEFPLNICPIGCFQK